MYDARNSSYLLLRHAPLVQVNTIIMYPDTDPTTYTASAFDIRYGESRLSFIPGQGETFWGWNGSMEAIPQAGLNVIQADYFAGYGWGTPLTAAITAGSNVVLPMAVSGLTPGQGSWMAAGGTLVLDDGLDTAEEVSVTVAGGTVTAASVAADHASGAFVSGALVPSPVQMAAAALVGNLLAATDLTKAMEAIGRSVGYWSQVRQDPAGLYMSSEIRRLLGKYRDCVV